MAESLEEKIARVTAEGVAIVDYNAAYPAMFQQLKKEILALLPADFFLRFEHFGSTAVPGLAAKPVLDVAAEVRSLAEARHILPPIFEPRGDDYFWRPSGPGTKGPWYCWLIIRQPNHSRRAHIHILEPGSSWMQERLAFRDYLRQQPEIAAEYARLKRQLAEQFPDDRVAYTEAKGNFIRRINALAQQAPSSEGLLEVKTTGDIPEAF